jgi:hypothetical protein
MMAIYDDLSELQRAYRAKEGTIKKVVQIFQQGDYRYSDPWNAIIVAGFLDNKAINMERKEENKPDIKDGDLGTVKGPQEVFKLYAKKIAEKEGFSIKEYESFISGGKTDILAVRNSKKLLIECCSCRISKAIDYLSIPDTSLWVLLRNFKDKIIIFEFSRGKNWDIFNKFHNEYMMNQLHKHYDRLFSGTS